MGKFSLFQKVVLSVYVIVLFALGCFCIPWKSTAGDITTYDYGSIFFIPSLEGYSAKTEMDFGKALAELFATTLIFGAIAVTFSKKS